MVTEEVRLLKTLVSDLEKELKSKGKIPLLSEIMLKTSDFKTSFFQLMRILSWKLKLEVFKEN